MTSPPASGPLPPRGLTVRAWFLLVLAVMGTLTLTAGFMGAAVLGRTTAATDHLVDEVAPARVEAYRLQAALLDQETGVRGYLLTGDRALLEPYTRGRLAEHRAVAELEDLIADSPRQIKDLRAVQRTTGEWRARFAAPATDSGRRNGAITATAGKAYFDNIRTALSAQQKTLATERAQAHAELIDTRTQRDRAFLIALAVFVITCIALGVLLHFTVLRPLTSLRAGVARVADGAFGEPISSSGPSDVKAVALAVEGMRSRIVEELTRARQNEAELAEQAADLDARAVELTRSNAELEQFAYVASHDLQEPLRKVASFCQLLERRYSDNLDERGVQYIAFAVDGAKRMQILINDLLTFSRVGRTDETQDAVDLENTIDRALRNLASAVEESDAEISISKDLPSVKGDPTLLTMLWQNLLGNAVKFRRPEHAPHIRITAEPDEDDEAFWRFSVTDNGIGIPADFADKVFVIFQRLHGRDAYGGTGIGLALCKKIIEHGGGRIRIDTSYTDGTRLVFTLPLAVTTDPAPADAPALTTEGTRS